VAFEILNLAKELSNEVIAVFAAHGDIELEEIKRCGLKEIVGFKDGRLQVFQPKAVARLIKKVAEERGVELILFGATPQGKELAPRVAALFDVPMASDVLKAELSNGKLLVKRSLFAGKVYGNFLLGSKPFIVTVRPKSYERAVPGEGEASITSLDAGISDEDLEFERLELREKEGEEVDVTEADIIVSGGRGVKGPEGFKPLKELIEALKELNVGKVALGASRAAVDAGWIDHSHQVGQTGKVVSPKLYIACGISGAIQHLAGMRTSKVIVAINKDPEAPIFKVADYGIVGDLFQVVPKLTEEIRKLKAG
jgi:electron transfer flavoprotein alpha subunit